MRVWFYYINTIIFCYFQIVSTQIDTAIIELTNQSYPTPVWASSNVDLVFHGLAEKWFFNDVLWIEFVFDNSSWVIVSNTIPINGTSMDDGADTRLILYGVNHKYSGKYSVESSTVVYISNLVVHEVNLTSATISFLHLPSDCKPYLNLEDSIDPPSGDVLRAVNSSILSFASNGYLNSSLFEILNGTAVDANKPISAPITVRYIFNSTGQVMWKSINASTETLFLQPVIEHSGNSTHCVISVQHRTNISCVQNITYCWGINSIDTECNSTNAIDPLEFIYPMNTTSVTFSIEYDVFFGQYNYSLEVEQCNDDELTTVEPTSVTSSLTSNTASANATTSSDTSLAPVTTTPTPPSGSNSTPTWAIVVIAVLASLLVLLIISILVYCFCKRTPNKKTSSEMAMEERANDDRTVRKTIPEPSKSRQQGSLPSIVVQKPNPAEQPRRTQYSSLVHSNNTQSNRRLSADRQPRRPRSEQSDNSPSEDGSISPAREYETTYDEQRRQRRRLPPLNADSRF